MQQQQQQQQQQHRRDHLPTSSNHAEPLGQLVNSQPGPKKPLWHLHSKVELLQRPRPLHSTPALFEGQARIVSRGRNECAKPQSPRVPFLPYPLEDEYRYRYCEVPSMSRCWH